MEQIYLVLDSNGIPIAQAVLESPANADVMQLRILQGSADTVTARRDVQLIGMDDRAQARRGLVIRQRGDQVVIQPTAALGAEARENLRILTDFESVIYPVTGRWKGFRKVVGKDLSCGGVAFWADRPLEEREIVEMVLPVTDSPLIVKTQILRELPDDTTEKPLYASKFVDLIQDEEALIRKAVFCIQIDSAD